MKAQVGRKTRRKKSAAQALGPELQSVNLDAAGIDVGSREHFVCVPAGRDEKRVRAFGSFHADLDQLARWLKKCGVRTVAMESTGVYWIPLFQVLERAGFEVILVNARHVKNVPGRKTDMADCQWLQQLHTFGLLRGCFRPPDEICALRSYLRLREDLVRDRSRQILLMQKALQQMNVQLHHVLSDITGQSGLAIVRAIVEGETDARKLVKMVSARVHASAEKIVSALSGDYRAEHVFALKVALELFDSYTQKMVRCEEAVEAALRGMEARDLPQRQPLGPPKTNLRASEGADPKAMREELYRVSGVDLTAIEGISVRTAQIILSEIGRDMSRWPSEKHFTSWLGLCPNQKISGGAVLSSKPRRVANHVRRALMMSASTLRGSKSALGGYFRKMQSRLGKASGIVAAAHKLARIVYHLLKHGEAYVKEGLETYEKKSQQRMLKGLLKTAQALGYELVAKNPQKCVS